MGKRDGGQQENNGDEKDEQKAVVIDLLFLFREFVEEPEKGCLHAECKQRLKDTGVAEHGAENTVCFREVGSGVKGRQQRAQQTLNNGAESIDSSFPGEFLSC